LFAAIGLGLWSWAAGWGLLAGIVAALAVTAIFYLRRRARESVFRGTRGASSG